VNFVQKLITIVTTNSVGSILYMLMVRNKSRNSSIGIATRLWAGRPGF